MSYHGDIALGDTIDIKFATTAASTGAPTQLAGTPVISAYVDNSTTQITAGITLTVDFDSVTGLNNVRVVASSGNGYTTSTNVQLVITTGTVGGTSAVGYVVGSFSIEKRSALRPTTAGRTLDVTAAGEAGLDFANVAIPDGPVPALGILEGGTAQSATGTTLVGRAAATDDIVKAGHYLWAFGATQGYWQAVMIDSVSGDTFTIAAWPVTTPTGTITYRVYGVPTQSSALPVPANATQLAGVTQSLTDLKDFADAGYDPSTNKVQGVVLTDTVTTYTGNTPQTGDSFARLGAPAGASVSADIAAIEAQTDDIGAAGAGLTALASAANLATVAGYLDTEIAAILALLDDPRTEPGQGAPPVNPDLATKIDYIYKAWRNKSTQTSSQYSLYADDTTTIDQKATVSSDGTTLTRGEVATGP